MNFKTNEDLIQKQKIFILEILEQEEGITPDRVVFSDIQYLPLSEIEPIHNGDKANISQMILAFSLGTAFPPVLVHKKTKILMDGNHRYLASEQLRYSHVPVLFYSIK